LPRIPRKRPLNAEEHKNLIFLLKEAQSRGITLPKESIQIIQDKKKVRWPVAPNGYFLRNDGYLYNPSETHEKFIKSTALNVALYGPRGCGKSGAGAQKALFKIMQGENGIIMNPDFENLKISTWPALKEWLPWNMVIPSQRHRSNPEWQPTQPFAMVFMNGAKVIVKGGKESGSSRGPNVNWFWYDEAGRDNDGAAWHTTNAGVRVGKDPQAWATYTPRPTEHWSYKFFITQELPADLLAEFEELSKGDRILIEWFHATREDNRPNLDKFYYLKVAASYPSGHLRAQEFDGEYANEGGKIGSRKWFEGGIDPDIKDDKEHPSRIMEERLPQVMKRVRFWDLAATEKKVIGIGKRKELNDPDETVGSLVSKYTQDKKTMFCIEHQVGGFWAWDNLLDAIANTARHDGPYVPVVIEEEPGSGGKNQVAAVKTHFKRFPELASHQVIGQKAKEVGDRVMAANHWFAVAAEGRMWIVKGEWNSKFLGQLDGFTQIAHDDRVTSITGAMNYLSPFKAWARTPFISL
jgi:predicted phage terminase large subunit-like protein